MESSTVGHSDNKSLRGTTSTNNNPLNYVHTFDPFMGEEVVREGK